MWLEEFIKEVYTWKIYDDKNPHMLVSDIDIKILATAIRDELRKRMPKEANEKNMPSFTDAEHDSYNDALAGCVEALGLEEE